MKKINILKYAAALCLSAVCLFFSASDVDAKYVEDATTGISYNNEEYITSGYASNYSYGGNGYTYIYVGSNYRITNVKSSSKNLLAKKTYEYESKRLDKETNITTSTYGTTYISYYGKKKGTYTVKFDIINTETNTKVSSGKIKVYVDKYGTSYNNPFKSIKYAGKDIWQQSPYCKKTSGKISVKMNSGYKLVSIEIGKRNSNGDWVYKKVKNNKTIKLAKSSKYTYNGYSTVSTYNPLFPETNIRITYKNKKTKVTTSTTYSLKTMNKK